MPSTKKRSATVTDASKKGKASKAPKRVKTFSLQLSTDELTHIRDIMSVILPPDGSTRLSESLAVSEKRQMTESKLWQKVVELCLDAKLPVGDEAPDFFVGVSGPLVLGVFQLDQGEQSTDEATEEDE
jgi:hypothetical protein